MKTKTMLLLLLLAAVSTACEKSSDRYVVQGVVRDDVSQEPLADVPITVDAVKAGSGMGILNGGRRERLASTTTDADGFYHFTLKVFKDADRLEYDLNPDWGKEAYTSKTQSVYLQNISLGKTIVQDFSLSPTALFTVRFKNATPVSDADYFTFSYATGLDGTPRIVGEERNCSGAIDNSVDASGIKSFEWKGKDVCGTYTFETAVQQYTYITWWVTKGNTSEQYSDSVFVRRGATAEFTINY